jgi:hypothetical protein
MARGIRIDVRHLDCCVGDIPPFGGHPASELGVLGHDGSSTVQLARISRNVTIAAADDDDGGGPGPGCTPELDSLILFESGIAGLAGAARPTVARRHRSERRRLRAGRPRRSG